MKKSNIQKNFERKAASLRTPRGTAMPSNLSMPRFADGGSIGKALRIGSQDAGEVSGPGGPTDDKVPAMISNKEYVLSEKMKEAIGLENLEGLRARLHGHEAVANDMRNANCYADGGSVTGGTVLNRANMIEQVTSQPVTPPPVAPAPAPVAPQPVAPPAPTGNFDPAFLAKNGLGADGRPLPKPSIMDRAKKMIGLAEGGVPLGPMQAADAAAAAKQAEYMRQAPEGGIINGDFQIPAAGGTTMTRTITGTGNSGLRTSDSTGGSGMVRGNTYTPDAPAAPAMSPAIPPAVMAAARSGKPFVASQAPGQPVQFQKPPVDMSGSVMNPQAGLGAAFGRPGPTGTAFATGHAPYTPGPIAPTNIPAPMQKSMRDSYANSMLGPSKPISLHFQAGGPVNGSSLILPIEADAPAWRGRLAQAAPTVEKMIPQGGTVAKAGMRGLGAAGNAIVPAVEASRVYDVATNDKTDGLDVANQVASGVGRAASTAAGAGIGTALVPGIGTVLGGLVGYYGGDKAIKGLRSAAGTDTRDPAERIAPAPTAAAPVAQAAPTQAVRPQAQPAPTQTETPMQSSPAVDPRSLPVDPMNDRAARRAMYARQDAQAAQTSNPVPWTKEDLEAPGLRGAINRAYARNQAKFDAELNERRRSAMASDTTARQGQALNYDANLQGQMMTAATARWQGKIAQMNKDREYLLDREKFGEQQANTRFDQRQKAQKDLTEQISTMIPPTIGPDGKPMPNTAAAAQHMTALNALVGTVLDKRKQHQKMHPDDAENNAAVESLEKHGVAGLGQDEVRRFVAGNQLALETQQGHSAWNPLAPTAVASQKPITSLRRKPGIIFDDYVTDRGDVIPAHRVDRTGSILGIGGQRNTDYDILKKK